MGLRGRPGPPGTTQDRPGPSGRSSVPRNSRPEVPARRPGNSSRPRRALPAPLPSGPRVRVPAVPLRHRVTEWVRMEGTLVGHLAQPPCSSTLLEHMAQGCSPMVLECLREGNPQPLWAACSWSLHSEKGNGVVCRHVGWTAGGTGAFGGHSRPPRISSECHPRGVQIHWSKPLNSGGHEECPFWRTRRCSPPLSSGIWPKEPVPAQRGSFRKPRAHVEREVMLLGEGSGFDMGLWGGG